MVNSLLGGAVFEVKRVMGCTPEDLVRWLPEALSDLYQQTSLVIDDRELLLGTHSRITMCGTTLKSRKIALLSIPVLELVITFDAFFSAEQIQAILDRFDLYTRRGGG
ncbi:hypothetical protein FD975_00960 [Polynucleobacter sp. AP-Jannik-300A-C4]|uniref:hypothetical protein n=1 Tax=Polynucleobacter sp. AP-Jannik-300A-C4 TaxID=2576928 RepID=UPI001BFD514A|nr:hypothetical protein [Polynucleobacter sp. AP-Jannik-300A-C4]QWE22817.1 hypothetical protein FD975_00960 [Polynucleobacter sp. AP-Jannik-300A-C4]